MKNAEGGAHPFELLDRRLKESTARLKDVTKVFETLGRSAGTLQRVARGEPFQEATTSGRTSKAQTASPTPPARGAQSSQSSARPAPAAQDDIPEWRKVFPDLSSKVPSRGK